MEMNNAATHSQHRPNTQIEVNLFLPCYLSLTGFVEKEIKKANIPIVDTGENPEVPFPRDMIDLEVTVS